VIEALLFLGALSAMALLLLGVVRSGVAGKPSLGLFAYPEAELADTGQAATRSKVKGGSPHA
jgi:hypothetical protein